ncbi:hypothetical protein F4779DRAFT_592701 [Xylariaceae sp. FL0662B]|nr:hypothetical protein F4779DRAFT_592701 [Xylariaceae sp. FL0662B]
MSAPSIPVPPPLPGLPSAPMSADNVPEPVVSKIGPPGALKVELLIFSGYPFKDHWAYWVPCPTDPDIGNLIHVDGNVRDGFKFDIRRSYDITRGRDPIGDYDLRWVDGRFFDETAMFNDFEHKRDDKPLCGFEESVHKVKAPEKCLRPVHAAGAHTVGIKQKNCQTWVVEAAEQLVKDNIFKEEVAKFLKSRRA